MKSHGAGWILALSSGVICGIYPKFNLLTSIVDSFTHRRLQNCPFLRFTITHRHSHSHTAQVRLSQNAIVTALQALAFTLTHKPNHDFLNQTHKIKQKVHIFNKHFCFGRSALAASASSCSSAAIYLQFICLGLLVNPTSLAFWV